MSDFVSQPGNAQAFTAQHKPTTQPAVAGPAPSHGDIARRAYDIYLTSGCLQGRCQQNWQQAERELRRLAATAAAPSPAAPATRTGTAPAKAAAVDATTSIMAGRYPTRSSPSTAAAGSRRTDG